MRCATIFATATIALAAGCGSLDQQCGQPATIQVSLSSLGDAADPNDCANDCTAYFAGAYACAYLANGIQTGTDLNGQPTFSGPTVQCGDSDPGNGGEVWPVAQLPTSSCNLACAQLYGDAGGHFSGTCSFSDDPFEGQSASCTYPTSCSYQGYT
jgi:hypothetical protein